MEEQQQSIDLRTVLAFVLLIGIAVLYPVYMKWMNPPEPEIIQPYTAPADTIVQTTMQQDSVRDLATTTDATLTEQKEVPTEPDTASMGFVGQDATERTISVETDKYLIELSSRGARPTRIALKDYTYNDESRKGQPIELIPQNETDVGPVFTFFRDTINVENVVFTTTTGNVSIRGNDSSTVRFRVEHESGGVLGISYVFHGGRYSFDVSLSVDNPEAIGVVREYEFGWRGGLLPTEPDYEMDAQEFKADAFMGEDLEEISNIDEQNPRSYLNGDTYWTAVRTKYFLAAFIPRDRAGEGFLYHGTTRRLFYTDRGWSFSDLWGGGERFADSITVRSFSSFVRMEVPYSNAFDDRFTIVAGPIDYNMLGDYGVGLENLVNMGWTIIKPFSLAILWLFKMLHSLIGNYGIVIMIFALLIKVVFHPLSRKQIKAMARMKELAPRMQALRERYKSDPQRMNQETMKLYKEAGFNPLAGCLPLLPQMPIFFALFTVFRSTIELRGAEFLYLADLSQKDPYYILPIFMMVTMFLSQMFTQTAGASGQQQKIFQYLMPPFMAFIFRNFPGGLNLYWALFNLFSFAEQWWMRRKMSQS